MGKIKKTLDQGDKIINEAQIGVVNSLEEAEVAIFKEIIKIFNEVDISAGKLRSTAKAKSFLMSLDNRITAALYNSKYRLGVQDLIKDYDKITANNIALQSQLNGLNITKASLSDIQALEVNNTIDALLGNGLNKDFIAPVRQALYRNITIGAGVEETKAELESYVISKHGHESVLRRYVGQIAEDSIRGFDGMIQQAIRAELDLPDWLYTGSLILDSRDQCVFWVGKAELSHNYLPEEIQIAIDRGTLTGERPCSGMKPDTTLNNFSSKHGGWRCRHRATAIKL